MKAFIALIWIALLPCTCMANEWSTRIANLKDKEGCELQIKWYASEDNLISDLQELKKQGFSLRSFASVDDSGTTDTGKYAFRFVCYFQGRLKSGSNFVEGRGGVSKTLAEALRAALNLREGLRKDVGKQRGAEVVGDGSGPLLELKKIIIVHEHWESWNDDAPGAGEKESKNKAEPQR